jgi:hypothetical protein
VNLQRERVLLGDLAHCGQDAVERVRAQTKGITGSFLALDHAAGVNRLALGGEAGGE